MSKKKPVSEAQDLNREKPFLTVTARVTPKDTEKAARYFRVLQSLKMILIFVLILVAAVIVIALIHGYQLSEMGGALAESRFWIYALLYIAFSAIYHVWYQPRQARRALIQVYGNAPYWDTRYSLYDDKLTIEAVGAKTSYKSDVEYSDIRKIRELKYQILLRTKDHNILSINKLGLSKQDAAALLHGLRGRMKV